MQRAAGLAYLAAINAQLALAAAEADAQRREVLARAARTLADNQLRPGAEASRADAESAAARTRAIQARQRSEPLGHATANVRHRTHAILDLREVAVVFGIGEMAIG